MDDKIQLKKFNSSHIDKKYELVIVGNQIIHPPQMGLIEDFAKQGESSVTFLLEKLEKTDNELTVRDIIFVFRDMKLFKSYDISENNKAMYIIHEKIINMKSDWKSVALKHYTQIINGFDELKKPQKNICIKKVE